MKIFACRRRHTLMLAADAAILLLLMPLYAILHAAALRHFFTALLRAMPFVQQAC